MHKIFRPSVEVSKSVSRSLCPPNLILFFVHDFSQSTSIPKKQQRVRDHGYDKYMEIEKKIRKVLKVQELILSQLNSMLSSARLDKEYFTADLHEKPLSKFIKKTKPSWPKSMILFVYHRRESVSDRFDRVDLDQVKMVPEKAWNEVKIGDNEQGSDGSESDLESDGECYDVDEEEVENKLID